MPVHNWTRVPAGIFHDFHIRWCGDITEALNEGLLPKGYYALTEQSVPVVRPDVITLSSIPSTATRPRGGTAVMNPPDTRLSLKAAASADYRRKRRTISIRHVSGHQIVALIEIVSPANKDREKSVRDFINKLYDALDSGIHVLLIDLFPPGPSDPHGLHTALWKEIDPKANMELLDRPLCLASYEAVDPFEAFLEPISVGDVLPDMPLFYDDGLYVQVPLEKTYDQAWRGVPEFWKDVVEGRRSIQA